MESLHPAPSERYSADHRDTANREQIALACDSMRYWQRAVQTLAAELQIEPLDAHYILMDAAADMTQGLAWKLWDRG